MKYFVLLVCLILLPTTAFCEGNQRTPVFLGAFKGSINTYMPKAITSSVIVYINSGTSGIDKDMADRAQDTSLSLFKPAKEYAANRCSGSKYFALDNVEFTTAPFGQYSNVLVSLSCNAVCVESY